MQYERIELELPDLGEDSVSQYTVKGWEYAGSTLSNTKKGYRVVMFRKPLPPQPSSVPHTSKGGFN